MTRKHDVGEIMTLAEAMMWHDNGLAVVVTDGRYVEPEIDKEA